MSEPLGQSQVLPYLRGLSRKHGWRFDVVAFEPPDVPVEQLRALADGLVGDGITYSWSRRSHSHAVAVKALEAGNALARLAFRALRRRPRIIHARSHLPAAVGLALAAATPGAKLIFDCRGLLGDEYVDTGYWKASSYRYRLVKRVERTLFARADAVVTLTDLLRRWLVDTAKILPSSTPTEVIPCCVDLDRFRSNSEARHDFRAAVGAGDRFVVVYSGTLGSWYREPDMARLFAAVRRRRPALLLVLTRSPADALLGHLAAEGVTADDVRVQAASPAEMPSFLSAADAGLALRESCFSRIAASPTKIAEYLAVGLPVAMNTDAWDGSELAGANGAIIDAGALTPDDCERAAEEMLRAAAAPGIAPLARRLAEERFSVETVGVARYARLYARLTAASHKNIV